MTPAARMEALLDERFPGRWVTPPPEPPVTDLEMARRRYALQIAARIHIDTRRTA
jgi:hypothetical protein